MYCMYICDGTEILKLFPATPSSAREYKITEC